MERYKIEAAWTEFGWRLRCGAFNVEVDAGADELDGAVDAIKSLVAAEAAARLDRGEFLPADDPLGPDPSGIALYIDTDFQESFVRRSETVRRNVSVPGWIDARLRRNNIDGSRLFQDAALEKLAELERTGKGLRRIDDLAALEDACAPGVLDEYFRRRMEQVLRDGMEKGRN